METPTKEISDLAHDIIEGYWILCEPAEVVSRAIQEYAEYTTYGREYQDGRGNAVTPSELLIALNEVIEYFEGRGLWDYRPMARPVNARKRWFSR
jgi:hypothetical protein